MANRRGTPETTPRKGARAYILDMVEQLMKLSVNNDEAELAIMLKATLDVGRSSAGAGQARAATRP